MIHNDFTALAIVTKHAALTVLCDNGPVVINVEEMVGTDLSEKQYRDMGALLETLRVELGAAGTEQELHDAIRIITDRAYQAKEPVEVDAR